jgi:hypothetical protein
VEEIASDPFDHCVQDVVDCLDAITGGRLSSPGGDANQWIVTKDSGIAGKAVTERPGLVWGRPDKKVRRLAVAMTLTEHHIELANAASIDAIVAHHPIADAASSGGVELARYLPLYDLAVLECHEAFHGLHSGIAYLHGHLPYRIDPAYGGHHGLVVMVGTPMPQVRVLGDVFTRLDQLLERATDREVLETERRVRGCPDLADSATGTGMAILCGEETTPIGASVLHVFPHTGFDVRHLDEILDEHPEVTTVIFSISSASAEHPVVLAAASRGLNVLVGTTHASEILENGLPLGFALDTLLPGVEVVLLRDRVVATPLERVGAGELGRYGREMAEQHLLPRAANRMLVTSSTRMSAARLGGVRA